MSKFEVIVKDIYSKYNLSLPAIDEVYLADSTVEADYGLNRTYNTSDIDIFIPEPQGVVFNFAPSEDLQRSNAYDRPCQKIKDFFWD